MSSLFVHVVQVYGPAEDVDAVVEAVGSTDEDGRREHFLLSRLAQQLPADVRDGYQVWGPPNDSFGSPAPTVVDRADGQRAAFWTITSPHSWFVGVFQQMSRMFPRVVVLFDSNEPSHGYAVACGYKAGSELAYVDPDNGAEVGWLNSDPDPDAFMHDWAMFGFESDTRPSICFYGDPAVAFSRNREFWDEQQGGNRITEAPVTVFELAPAKVAFGLMLETPNRLDSWFENWGSWATVSATTLRRELTTRASELTGQRAQGALRLLLAMALDCRVSAPEVDAFARQLEHCDLPLVAAALMEVPDYGAEYVEALVSTLA